MAELGAPRLRLYLFCAACALFGMGYGLLELEPTPPMPLLLWYGPAIGVATWLAADSKRTRLVGAYDAGLLFYVTWPLTLPWYAVRTRGRAGWGLAAQLYALAFSGQLGYLWGATIRFFLFESSAAAV
jgi:hypothetical protein